LAWFGAVAFFADFLVAVRFRTSFFAGVDFLLASFFDLADFFLLFFLVAIRAV
jgi:hypothetical protein